MIVCGVKFWIKKTYPCKVCAKFHVWVEGALGGALPTLSSVPMSSPFQTFSFFIHITTYHSIFSIHHNMFKLLESLTKFFARLLEHLLCFFHWHYILSFHPQLLQPCISRMKFFGKPPRYFHHS